MLKERYLILLLVLLSGCAAHAEEGHWRPSSGLGSCWTAFVLSLVSFVTPDTASKWVGWDDRSVMRLGGGALLVVASIGLADYYFNLDLVRLAKSTSGHGN